MADLVIKSECKSWLRDNLDRGLTASFPVWGVIGPVALFIMSAGCGSSFLQGGKEQLIKDLPPLCLVLCYVLACFLLKRYLSSNNLVLTKNGVDVPPFIGGDFGFKRHISWSALTAIDARAGAAYGKSSIMLLPLKGRALTIPLDRLQEGFGEQFVLAARMWAPDRCGENLNQLQDNLRVGAREAERQSYTDLWEEELGRRFCPTAYVPLEPGRSLRDNTIKIVRQLASGGLSALYLCQKHDTRLVVLKEAALPAQVSDSLKEKAVELFNREAALLSKIDYPGIVHVLDCFTELERNYMVLEYVPGIDLWQMVRQNGPQAEADVINWAVQLASTLKYLHEREQPIIHRDVTPDNIILSNDGKVVLVDFGAANEFIGTATGTLVGKHSFISPEQIRGKATTQSDIYAFGCTLFFLMVGREPEALAASNPREEMEKDGRGDQISDEFCQLIESCTQLEAEARYQTVAQLLPVLKRLAAQVAA